MSGYGSNALQFLIETLFDLYVMVVALRFMMQAVRADYYNPVSQFVVKATNPLLVPLRRVIPGVAGQDLASLALAVTVLLAKLLLLQAIGTRGVAVGGSVIFLQTAGVGALVWIACVDLVALLINIVFFAIIIQVILSWVAPGTHNPVASLLFALTQPVLRPIQRVIPAIGGLDLSPLVAIIALQLLKMLLLPPLLALL